MPVGSPRLRAAGNRTPLLARMSFLSRIFGRQKKVNVLSTMDGDAGIYRVEHDVPVQMRRAQSVPDELSERLIAVCEADADIASCSFLDVRDKGTGEMKFIVSLELDHPGALYRVVPHMQAIFRDFPRYAKIYLIGDQPFGKLDPAFAVYRRTG